MTLSLFAIVLGLAIVIAIPLARLINYLEGEMRFRRLFEPVHKAIARGVQEQTNHRGVLPNVSGDPGGMANTTPPGEARMRSDSASVTEIGAFTSKRKAGT